MSADATFDEAGAANFDVPLLKGPLRVREAQQHIAVLEQFIRDGEARGEQMCADFARQFPVAPAKLVRYRDRSLTFYRWRQSSNRKWGNNPATAISLTGESGLALLSRVPVSAREHWLNYERRRIYLNMQLALASYQLYRLQDWLDSLDTIKAIEARGIEAVRAARK